MLAAAGLVRTGAGTVLLLVLTPLPEQIRPALALLALPVLLLLLLFQLLRLRQLLQAQRW
jgi:hypothetical protein